MTPSLNRDRDVLTPLGEAIQSLKRKAQDSEDPAQTYKLLKQRAEDEASKAAVLKKQMNQANERAKAFEQAARAELRKQPKEKVIDLLLASRGGDINLGGFRSGYGNNDDMVDNDIDGAGGGEEEDEGF